MKARSGYNKQKAELIKIAVNFFLLISFYIMIAGFGAYFKQELGLNSLVGTVIISAFCYVSFSGNIKGVINVNTFLSPILIGIILILGIMNKSNINLCAIENLSINNYAWLINAIMYCGYNSLILIPILISLKTYITSKSKNIIVSTLTFLVMLLLGNIIFFLLIHIQNINNIEIPTVWVVKKFGETYAKLFGIIVLISIFTSAVSTGYAFLENLNKKNYSIYNKLICISAIGVAGVGFSNLLNTLYPVFGVLGFIQIIMIITKILEKNE